MGQYLIYSIYTIIHLHESSPISELFDKVLNCLDRAMSSGGCQVVFVPVQSWPSVSANKLCSSLCRHISYKHSMQSSSHILLGVLALQTVSILIFLEFGKLTWFKADFSTTNIIQISISYNLRTSMHVFKIIQSSLPKRFSCLNMFTNFALTHIHVYLY